MKLCCNTFKILTLVFLALLTSVFFTSCDKKPAEFAIDKPNYTIQGRVPSLASHPEIEYCLVVEEKGIRELSIEHRLTGLTLKREGILAVGFVPPGGNISFFIVVPDSIVFYDTYSKWQGSVPYHFLGDVFSVITSQNSSLFAIITGEQTLAVFSLTDTLLFTLEGVTATVFHPGGGLPILVAKEGDLVSYNYDFENKIPKPGLIYRKPASSVTSLAWTGSRVVGVGGGNFHLWEGPYYAEHRVSSFTPRLVVGSGTNFYAGCTDGWMRNIVFNPSDIFALPEYTQMNGIQHGEAIEYAVPMQEYGHVASVSVKGGDISIHIFNLDPPGVQQEEGNTLLEP